MFFPLKIWCIVFWVGIILSWHQSNWSTKFMWEAVSYRHSRKFLTVRLVTCFIVSLEGGIDWGPLAKSLNLIIFTKRKPFFNHEIHWVSSVSGARGWDCFTSVDSVTLEMVGQMIFVGKWLTPDGWGRSDLTLYDFCFKLVEYQPWGIDVVVKPEIKEGNSTWDDDTPNRKPPSDKAICYLSYCQHDRRFHFFLWWWTRSMGQFVIPFWKHGCQVLLEKKSHDQVVKFHP